MTITSILLAAWTGISAMFLVGTGVENIHAFAFAVYSGGTVCGLLLFVASLRTA